MKAIALYLFIAVVTAASNEKHLSHELNMVHSSLQYGLIRRIPQPTVTQDALDLWDTQENMENVICATKLIDEADGLLAS